MSASRVARAAHAAAVRSRPIRAAGAAAALGCAALAAPLAAQAPPGDFALRTCDTPRQPLGVLHGQGQVVYEMRRDGRPDTGSVRVVRSSDLSPAAFRSAAVRLLSACRFEAGSRPPRASTRVAERIVFHDSTAELRTPQPAPDSVAGVQPEAATAEPTGGPVEVDDPRLEERPRQLRCEHVQGARPPMEERYRSREEAERQVGEYARESTGQVEARVVIGADGRVERHGITVLSSTNPRVTDGLVQAMASCRYAPGRIAGRPVAVAMTLGMGVEVRVEPINP